MDKLKHDAICLTSVRFLKCNKSDCYCNFVNEIVIFKFKILTSKIVKFWNIWKLDRCIQLCAISSNFNVLLWNFEHMPSNHRLICSRNFITICFRDLKIYWRQFMLRFLWPTRYIYSQRRKYWLRKLKFVNNVIYFFRMYCMI